MSTQTPLLPLVQKFFESDPVRAAHSLQLMEPDEAVSIIESLPRALTTSAFRHLDTGHAAALLERITADQAREIIDRLDPQQSAAILFNLPEAFCKELLDHLSDKTKRQIQDILIYPVNSAGRLMTTEFLAFRGALKVREAIQRIRAQARRRAPASYAYVVDENDRLIGVVNMYGLIVTPGDTTLESIMRKDVFATNAFMDREEVAQALTQRKVFVLPVVDHEYRLLGVVKSDQLLAQIQEKATEDIQKMFGAGSEERAFSPIAFSLRKRLPWLHVNLATAFLAASVVALFEDIIAQITILAVFLPVVAGQGGNAGIQTLAIVMRGLVMHEIPPQRAWELLGREALIGALSGVATGLVTGAIAWLWYGNPFLGVVIGLAIVINMFTAGLAGAAIPLSMKAIGIDPAQSSGIILTTVTDVVGFFAFLGFAVWFQNYLI